MSVAEKTEKSSPTYADRIREAPDRCEYCGMLADTDDHVIPRSYRRTVQDFIDWKAQYPDLPDIVPACFECNVLLNDRLFSSLQERRDFVHGAIRKRYAHVLGMPEWSEDDLSELGFGLQEYMRSSQELAEVVRERLLWQGSDTPDDPDEDRIPL